MAAHEAAHEAVLQLLEPPDLGQLVPLAGEELLAQRRNGEDVEQCSVSIERQCLDGLELSTRLSAGRSLPVDLPSHEFSEKDRVADGDFTRVQRVSLNS